MTKLDEDAMESLSHQVLDRCLTSLQSVLQQIPDQHQRVLITSGVTSMLMAIVTVRGEL